MRRRAVSRVALLVLVLPIALAVFDTAAQAQASPPKVTPVVPVPTLPPPAARPAPPAPAPVGLGYEVVHQYGEIVTGRPFSRTVPCPPGKVVVGGGVSWTNLMPKAYFHIIESFPTSTGVAGRPERSYTQWSTTVVGDTLPAFRVYLNYYAICVNPS